MLHWLRQHTQTHTVAHTHAQTHTQTRTHKAGEWWWCVLMVESSWKPEWVKAQVNQTPWPCAGRHKEKPGPVVSVQTATTHERHFPREMLRWGHRTADICVIVCVCAASVWLCVCGFIFLPNGNQSELNFNDLREVSQSEVQTPASFWIRTWFRFYLKG